MNCEEFLKLDDFQKSVYMASLIHVCQSDSSLFKSGEQLIMIGKRKGLFEGVKIFPDHIPGDQTEDMPREVRGL